METISTCFIITLSNEIGNRQKPVFVEFLSIASYNYLCFCIQLLVFFNRKISKPEFLLQPEVEDEYLDDIKYFYHAIEEDWSNLCEDAQEQDSRDQDENGKSRICIGAHLGITTCTGNCLLCIHLYPGRHEEGHEDDHLPTDHKRFPAQSSEDNRNQEGRAQPKDHHDTAKHATTG